MRFTRRLTGFAMAVGLLLLIPAAAHAQSGIAGVVKDTTGAIMPGVTVDASSPALIEGTRTVVTDGAGLYKIVDLRPGTYSVTFTLTGFNVVKREGIELPDNFTATVNAELKVGSIEESVTVSGQSPVVDLQSPAAQQVLPRSVVDAVPTGRSLWSVGSLVPSVTLSGVDVGGSRGMQQLEIAVHGSDSKDTAVEVDGMLLNSFEDGVQQYYNDNMFEEFNYQTSAITAETQSAGVRLNMIPKEGGNTFKGNLFYSNEPGQWVGNNLTGPLLYNKQTNPLGLHSANPTKIGTDLSGAFGGPIAKDKLWFFTSGRRWGVDTYESNSYYNADPTLLTFNPSLGKQVVDDNLIKSGMLRLTYRKGPHKFAAYLDRIIKFRGHEGTAGNMEETFTIRTPRIYYTSEVKYTGTWTNKLLFETGISVNNETYSTGQPQSEVGSNVGRTELTGFTTTGGFLVGSNTSWAAPVGVYDYRWPNREEYLNSSLSYVTGSHAFKAGMVIGRGNEATQNTINSNMIQRYTADVPSSVVVWNTPVNTNNQAQYDAGIYAQDTWTFKRLTINPGVRFDLFNSYFPAETEGPCVFCQTPTTPAGTPQPARTFAAEAAGQQPHWKDVDPRLGFVYDLFGDNKTAVKGSWGRYVSTYHGGYSSNYNPSAVVTDTRNWTDLNHNDVADYGPLGSCGNAALDCEIAPSSNTQFGTSASRNPAPGIQRPYNYELAASIQRQVMAGMAITAGWTHRTYHNIYAEQNLATQPLGTPFGSGYTAYTIPDPIAAGQTLTVYNQNPALITPNYLDQIDPNASRTYTAFDLQFNSRVFGGTIFGGASWGKQVTKMCDGIDPNAASTATAGGIAGPTGTNGYCDQTAFGMPYRGQYKLSGSYPLPLGISVSASFQAYPGGSATQSGGDTSLNETYSINAATFKQLTGATLTQGALSIRLLQPGTVFLPYVDTVDLRLSKVFKFFGTRKLAANLDMFNLLNANPVTGYGRVLGSAFNQINSTITGRVIAVGGRLDF